jgi:hypothetical protein
MVLNISVWIDFKKQKQNKTKKITSNLDYPKLLPYATVLSQFM